MQNKLTLTTLAMVMMTGALGYLQLPTSCTNYSGYYYEDINGVFVDCFSEDGTLEARIEEFYNSTLAKECDNTTFS
jgi:hypothetical protein